MGCSSTFHCGSISGSRRPTYSIRGTYKVQCSKILGRLFCWESSVTLAGAFIGDAIGGFFESLPIVIASIALTALITGFLFKRKTEGEESDMLQDILEDSITEGDSEQTKRSTEASEDFDAVSKP